MSNPRPPGFPKLSQGFGKETVRTSSGEEIEGRELARRAGGKGGAKGQGHKFSSGEARKAGLKGLLLRWARYHQEKLQAELDAMAQLRSRAPNGDIDALDEMTLARAREQLGESRRTEKKANQELGRASRIVAAAEKVAVIPAALEGIPEHLHSAARSVLGSMPKPAPVAPQKSEKERAREGLLFGDDD